MYRVTPKNDPVKALLRHIMSHWATNDDFMIHIDDVYYLTQSVRLEINTATIS
jgi:hypothetical protein